MNTAAFRNAQWAYDTREEDWSDHYRDQAIESLADKLMSDPDMIEDAFENGFKVSTEFARMFAKWNGKPDQACTTEMMRALSDALWRVALREAKADIERGNEP